MHRLHDRGGGRHQASSGFVIAAVVVPWRDEGDSGESLRYALRSWWENLPHNRVVVVGDPAPGWYADSDHLTFIERPRDRTRFDDSQTSVLTGLAEVGGWAYICHDDIFTMLPVDYVGPSVRGYLPVLAQRMARNPYYKRGDAVRKWLISQGINRPLNYNVHVPFLVHADTYIELAARAEHLIAGYRASVYGNLLRLPARKVPDPKITSNGVRPNDRLSCWSMGDNVWKQGLAGKLVRRRLPDPAPWESG